MKVSTFILFAAMAAFILVLPCCSRDNEEQQSTKIKTPAPQPETVTINGLVEEKLDAGNFIFVLIASDEEKVWVTVPKVEVEIGETVTMSDANLLENFHSKTLNRTFAKVMFSPGIEGKTPLIKKPTATTDTGNRLRRRSQGLSPIPQ